MSGTLHTVLSGMTSASGAMVAAATMSLPERAEEGRNYDYRYAWIRDQCFAGIAVANGTDSALLDDAVRFVTARLHDDGPQLAPAYTVAGGRVPEETQLHLPGIRAARTCRQLGDHQFQLDAFGEALQLFAAADADDRLDADGWAAAEIATDAIAALGEPDVGIWELDPAKWTQSRLACAAGLRAAARRPRAGTAASAWESLADTIVADPARHALHASGRWQRCLPTRGRCPLLAGVRGAVGADDPRTQATLRSVLTSSSRTDTHIASATTTNRLHGRRAVSPVRLPGFAGAARPGRPHRRRPLVRTQSTGVRTSRTVHRGIRRSRQISAAIFRRPSYTRSS